MNNEILEFIHRRFPIDCSWVSGNCYYFSLILKDRFNEGEIYYDVIDGHFCVLIDNTYYDWKGVYSPTVPIAWDEFEQYDCFQKERIIRDCIK